MKKLLSLIFLTITLLTFIQAYDEPTTDSIQTTTLDTSFNIYDPTTITITSPEEIAYPKTSIKLLINLTQGSCDLTYSDTYLNSSTFWKIMDSDENQEPEEIILNEKYYTLCRKCSSYNRQKTFREGFHFLAISCLNRPYINATTGFLIDSTAPRIISQSPRNKQFTNGSEFSVKYTEDFQIKTTLSIFTINKTQEESKPKVELFGMTYCPYCAQAEKGILPVVNLLENKIDFKIRYIQYFMHGKKEEIETYRQICIREEESSKFLQYIECFVKDGNATRCLNYLNINVDDCMQNRALDYYQQDSILSTNYGIEGSPTLVINGKIVNEIDRSPAGFLQTICNTFETQPDECNEILSSTRPYPGFDEYSSTSTPTTEPSSGGGQGGYGTTPTTYSKQCDSGKNKECKFNINLKSLDNQDIFYMLSITDYGNRTISTRPTIIRVDTTLPIINNPSSFYTQKNKEITFKLNITEQNFEKITYLDNYEKVPKPKLLCTRLKNNLCEAKKFFTRGNHNLEIQILDKAGNNIQLKNIIFTTN